jgi:hypothetical protein
MGTNRDIRIPATPSTPCAAPSIRSWAQSRRAALQEAGYAAGDALFDRLTRAASESDIAGTPSASFWDRLSSMCRELGWGTVRHEELHPGVGALVATDWFEVEPDRARALAPSPPAYSPTSWAASPARMWPCCRWNAGATRAVAHGSSSARPRRSTASIPGSARAATSRRRSARWASLARVLGIDYGERRIGLAISDPTATIAQPLPTLERRRGKRPPVAPLARSARKSTVGAIVVGLPLTPAGDESDWTSEVRAFGTRWQNGPACRWRTWTSG